MEPFKKPEDTISIYSDDKIPDNNAAGLVEIRQEPFEEQEDKVTTSLPDIMDNDTSPCVVLAMYL